MTGPKRPARAFGALLVATMTLVALGGCMTTARTGGTRVVGSGDEFAADSVFLSAGADWGTAIQVARFVPGIGRDGIEAIEIELPYGETAIAYNFDGFSPGESVEISISVDFDFFMTNSFVYFSYMSGHLEATTARWPRPHITDRLQHKWIDSIGRFAGEPWPDATSGWETVTGSVQADESGSATLIMVVNHWTESPPLVYAYFRNPIARSGAQEQNGGVTTR